MNSAYLLLAQTALPSEGFFDGFSTDQRFTLVIVALSSVALLALVLGVMMAGLWSSIREKQIEADLKRDMLDRGMTAEEVQKVIEAAPRSGLDRWMTSWCKKS